MKVIMFIAFFIGIVCLCYWYYLYSNSTNLWVAREVQRRFLRGEKGSGVAYDIASKVQSRRNKKVFYCVIGIIALLAGGILLIIDMVRK